jgi:hypothetical protein
LPLFNLLKPEEIVWNLKVEDDWIFRCPENLHLPWSEEMLEVAFECRLRNVVGRLKHYLRWAFRCHLVNGLRVCSSEWIHWLYLDEGFESLCVDCFGTVQGYRFKSWKIIVTELVQSFSDLDFGSWSLWNRLRYRFRSAMLDRSGTVWGIALDLQR